MTHPAVPAPAGLSTPSPRCAECDRPRHLADLLQVTRRADGARRFVCRPSLYRLGDPPCFARVGTAAVESIELAEPDVEAVTARARVVERAARVADPAVERARRDLAGPIGGTPPPVHPRRTSTAPDYAHDSARAADIGWRRSGGETP